MLPLTMVDSGLAISNGRIDFYNVYKGMVETALARPAEAAITAYWWRTADRIEIAASITNLSGETLTQTYLTAIVVEENRVQLTNRFGHTGNEMSINELAPGETAHYRLPIFDPPEVASDRLRVVVMADRPQTGNPPYDMLQAAYAQPVEAGLTVSPKALMVMVDPTDPPTLAAGSVLISGGGFSEWTAMADSPWLLLSPSGGPTFSEALVAVDTSLLNVGWQEGRVFLAATDAAFSDELTVRAYLGPVQRLYVPVIER